MTDLTLGQAEAILRGAVAFAAQKTLRPLLILALDSRACAKAMVAQDGTSTGRFAIAFAKANGALAMGMGSRALATRARDQPLFYGAVSGLIPGGLIPGPGGVLIHDANARLLGALGISGDTGDNDEQAAIAGITTAGLIAVTGEP